MADNTSSEKIMFEMGLSNDPKNITSLEQLATKVLETQSRMLDGVNAVQGAAQAATTAVGGAADAINRLKDAAGQAAQIPSTLPGGSSGSTGGSGVPGGKAPPTPKPSGPKASDFDEAVKERERYLKALETQRAAMAKYTQELDEAANSQSEASEQMAQSALKSARGLIDAVKGFAQLGIASEENTQKLLESMIVIEGYFNIAKGGIEALEGLRAGWKAVRASTEAVTAATKARMALAGPELAQLRAYNAALAQEAAAANAAAAANSRLGAARGAAGAAATGAAGAAATGAAASTATAVAGGGFTAATVGGVAVGTAGMVAAAAAALASVSLVAVELTEVFSGTANEVGSVTDTIASWEVSMVSWMGEMTGWFDLVGNAATAEAESKSHLLKVQSDLNDQLAAFAVTAEVATEAANRDGSLRSRRFREDFLGNSQSSAQLEDEILTESVTRYAEVMKQITAMRDQGLDDTKEYAAALGRAGYYQKQIEESARATALTSTASAKEQVAAAQKVAEQARSELNTRKQTLQALEESQKSAAERFASLDDFQKAQAIDALKMARSGGATALSDEQRSLLRSVGGEEATQFARDADLEEARRAGFDTSFGTGFAKQRKQLETEAKQLEVQIAQQNQIVINIENRNQQLVQQVVAEYDRVIRDADRAAIEKIKQDLKKDRAAATQAAATQARAAKSARG